MARDTKTLVELVRSWVEEKLHHSIHATICDVDVDQCVTTDEYLVTFRLSAAAAEDAVAPAVPIHVHDCETPWPLIGYEFRETPIGTFHGAPVFGQDNLDAGRTYKVNLNRKTEAVPESQATIDELRARLCERQGEIDRLQSEIQAMSRRRQDDIDALYVRLNLALELLAKRQLHQAPVSIGVPIKQWLELAPSKTALADVPGPKPRLVVNCEGDWEP